MITIYQYDNSLIQTTGSFWKEMLSVESKNKLDRIASVNQLFLYDREIRASVKRLTGEDFLINFNDTVKYSVLDLNLNGSDSSFPFEVRLYSCRKIPLCINNKKFINEDFVVGADVIKFKENPDLWCNERTLIFTSYVQRVDSLHNSLFGTSNEMNSIPILLYCRLLQTFPQFIKLLYCYLGIPYFKYDGIVKRVVVLHLGKTLIITDNEIVEFDLEINAPLPFVGDSVQRDTPAVRILKYGTLLSFGINYLQTKFPNGLPLRLFDENLPLLEIEFGLLPASTGRTHQSLTEILFPIRGQQSNVDAFRDFIWNNQIYLGKDLTSFVNNNTIDYCQLVIDSCGLKCMILDFDNIGTKKELTLSFITKFKPLDFRLYSMFGI